MSPIRRLGRAVLVAAPLLLTSASRVRAQDTTQVRPDSLIPDQQVADSAPPLPATLPIFEPEIPVGPLAPGSRYTFTRDSLLWSGGLTLADILAEIPGVYVLRAGFVGQPEYIQYAGRGGAALEVFWDGVPQVPLGGDTLFIDAGQYPLTYFRQIDVEVLPGLLRVYLVSERHESPTVRSKVRVQSGAFKSAQYTALFQKRFRSGLALNVAGNYIGTDGPERAAGSDALDLWLSLGWLPTPHLGARYEIRRRNINRDGIGTAVPEREGNRSDMHVSFFAQTRGDGLGLRADVGFSSSFWLADSGGTPETHGVRQVFAGLRYRLPTFTLGAQVRAADARTPFAVEGRVGWVPLPFVVLSADAGHRRHTGDRTSWWLRGSAGLYAGPFSLVGEAMSREAVGAPALPGDTAQATTDLSLRAGLDTKFLGGYGAVQQRDAYLPLAFPELPVVPALAPTPEVTYVVADAYLRPFSPLTLSGTFSHPVRGEATDFQPPQHLRGALTFRSKFWRTFRSGAFDLKLQGALERWSAGTAGLREDGTPVALPPAQFWELQVKIQLVDFTGFWIMRNSSLSQDQYVPGLPYPGNAQFFGASWTFSN